MRYFIGVPLPENVKARLLKAQQCFRSVDARMSLVTKDNFHVTLNFIGDIDNVAKIDESLKQIDFKPFKASLKDISFFPKREYIRVIHSPVNQGRQNLIELYNKIVEVLGLKSDERFSPHVTMARVKFVRSTNALSRACFNERFEEEFNVDSFNLYSSKLTPQGSFYSILHSYLFE